MKIINVDFQARQNPPPAGGWFPEESLTRLELILMEESADLEEGVEEKVEGPEE